MGQDLGELIAAAAGLGFDPDGDCGMPLGPGKARQAAVGHISGEGVNEGVLSLTLHGGLADAAYQPPLE